MRKLINKIISKTKGENYEIDKDISNGALFSILFTKGKQLWRGFWNRIHFKKNHKGKRVFIGKCVIIKNKKLIQCGRGVTIGDYSYIDALSHGGILFGNNVSLGRNCTIECTGVLRELGEHLEICDGVGIASGAFISVRGPVYIGKDTIIGPNFNLYSENHNYANKTILIRLQGATRKGVNIGENCWIGGNVTILDGIQIGDKSIIAAGAVVTKNVESNTVVAGVPAKIIKRL